MKIFQSIITLVILLLSNTYTYADEKITYYHYDLLGSPVATSNELGLLVWREDYSPYGNKLENEDVVEDNVRGYTGHVFDEETNLTYMQARYYDPEIGRFMGIDPVGFQESNSIMFNRYAYANNNPYKYVDPDGQDSYLVSRPLSFTSKANHNFVVHHAESLGDPDANVRSFGDVGDDTMGEVTKDTNGFSKGTVQTDTTAWQSLSANGSTATYRKIDAPDDKVSEIADSVNGGQEYSAVPEIFGGVNSNSGAGAVANRADGGSPSVDNGVKQPGASVHNDVEFKDDM